MPGWFVKLVALADLDTPWGAGLRHLWMDIDHHIVSKEFGRTSAAVEYFVLSLGWTHRAGRQAVRLSRSAPIKLPLS